MKKTIITIVLLLVTTLSTVFSANAAEITYLTNNNLDDASLVVGGGSVAWANFDGINYNIYYFDGTTIRQIIKSNSPNTLSCMDEGGRLVFSNTDSNNFERSILLFNPSDGSIKRVNSSGSESRYDYITNNYQKCISEGQVVWFNSGSGRPYLFNGLIAQQLDWYTYNESPIIDHNEVIWKTATGLYSFKDGVTQDLFKKWNLTNVSLREYDINNGQIVFSAWVYRNGFDHKNSEIFFYNGSKLTQLTDNDYSDIYPTIKNGRIAWSGAVGNQDYEIFLYDSNNPNSVAQQITNNTFTDGASALHGDGKYLVWQGDNNFPKIFLYDGDSVKQINSTNHRAYNPKIDNNKIVWTQWDGNDYEIAQYTISSIPTSFFAQVKNTANPAELRNTRGTQNKPSDDVIKTVPNDWVLKVATTTDPVGNYFDLDDGYRWYGVIDETDGAKGWMKAKDLSTGTEYLSYDESAQTSLGAKASTTLYTTIETRTPVILQAVDTYYTQANTLDSLYGGGGGAGGKNNFKRFIQWSTFPKELVLAIISQESVSINFDNEGCSSNLDGGIGIMQITSLDARGSGSALKNYPKMGDCTEVYTSKYYSNAWQGIFANIKDGFRTLQDKYSKLDSGKNEAVGNITVGEMKAISTVYRYNQGSPYKVQAVYSIFSGKSNDFTWSEYLHYAYKNKTRADGDIWMNKVRGVCVIATTFNDCLRKTNIAGLTTSAFYLRDVGNSLKSSIFGNDYEDSAYGDKMIAANNSQVIVFLRSPAELRVINSFGEVTGSVAGVPKEEIANSVYYPEQKIVTILFPQEQYKYRVVGLETGEYGLSVEFVNNGEFTLFDADNIPITAGEVHDYVVDQDKLSQCERGAVTLYIDYQGDGVVDRTVSGGCRISEIVPPTVNIISPSGQYFLNSNVTIQFTASDVSGIASTTATLNGATVTNEQAVKLIKPGVNILEVSVIDNEGNTATTASKFNVLYVTDGFLSPFKSDGTMVYNQGRTIPVKFELRDVDGNKPVPILATLYIAKISNGIVGNDEIPLSVSAEDHGNQFRYDQNGHMYIFNLSTDVMTTGPWQIKAVLDGGQEIKAVILIK